MLLVLDPDSLQVDYDPRRDELESLLSDTGTPPPVVMPARELQEAIWDEAHHPRWPPGTKSASDKDIGGEFMRAGEQFDLDGHHWEIHSVADGHVIAIEASGNVDQAQTRVFDPSIQKFADGEHPTLPGATPSVPHALKSGRGFYSTHNTPVVDGDTHPETHDRHLAIPAGSDFTEADWKRFGRVDQLYYRELMKRYGPWTNAAKEVTSYDPFLQGKVDNVVKAAVADGYKDAPALIQSALQGQKQSAKGYEFDLGKIFKDLDQAADEHSPALLVAWRKYQRGRELTQEINGVLAWELYNRLRAPDITLRHQHDRSDEFWQPVIAGKQAIMAGNENQWTDTSSWPEPHEFSFAMPLRNLLLFQDLYNKVTSNLSHSNERGVAGANRLRVAPGSALNLTKPIYKDLSTSEGQQLAKWWKSQLGKHPGAGDVIRALVSYKRGEGTLPLPPPTPDLQITHDPSFGVDTPWIPPDEWWHGVEKAVSENPGTAGESQSLSTLGLTPGDVIAGSDPSLRYVVVKVNPGPKIFYVALNKEPGGTGYSSYGNKLYSTSSPRRKVAGLHFDLPPAPSMAKAVHVSADWSPTGPAVPVGQFAVGEKLRLGGEDWRVLGHEPGAKVKIESLNVPGKIGTVNAGAPMQRLADVRFTPKSGALAFYDGQIVKVGKAGFTTSEVQLLDGGHEVVKNGALSAPPSLPSIKPEKGDTFAFQGAKMTITSVLKNGTVKAKAHKPGAHVQAFAPGDPALGALFRASDYGLASKQKLSAMQTGQLFSGSAGTLRPYMLLGKVGKDAHVLNLDTDEKSILSAGKSYPLLVGTSELADAASSVETTGASLSAAPSAGDVKVPIDPTALPDALKDGALLPFQSSYGPGGKYKHEPLSKFAEGAIVLDKSGKAWKVKATGAQPVLSNGAKLFKADGTLKVKAAEHAAKPPVFVDQTEFPKAEVSAHAESSVGVSMPFGQLHAGDVYQIANTSYQVVGTNAGGETLVKAVGYPDDYAYPSTVKPTETVTVLGHKALSALAPGDIFKYDEKGPQFTVVGKEQGKIKVKTPDGAAEGVVVPDQPVIYVGKDLSFKAPKATHIDIAKPVISQPFGAAKGQNVKASDLPTFTVAEFKGKYVYKALTGKWFEVGKSTPKGWKDYEPAVVDLKLPKVDELVATDHKQEVGSLPVGAVFKAPIGELWMVLGQGQGTTAVLLGSDETNPQIAYSSKPAAQVSVYAAKADASRPEQPAQHAEGSVGASAPLKGAQTGKVGLPPGFMPSPEQPWESDFAFKPGDQFVDQFGDLIKVVKQDPDGTVHQQVSADGATIAWKHELNVIGVKAAPGAGASGHIPDYSAIKLTDGASAGGSTGAQSLKGPDGKPWLVKTYKGNKDRVATELLSNAIYRRLGVAVPKAGKGPSGSLAYPMVEGEIDEGPWSEARKAALAKDYVADALLANHDFVGLTQDNVLWQGDKPVRLDQGGTLLYRAQGEPKLFLDTPQDLFSMLSLGQAGQAGLGEHLSEHELRTQAKDVAAKLPAGIIDDIVDEAPFGDEAMRAKVRSALQARVKWLAQFGAGEHEVPASAAKMLAPSPMPDTPAMPITPYTSKWASGGKFAYAHIAELAVGQKFRDKSGKLYQVAGHIDADHVHQGQTPPIGKPSTTYAKDEAGSGVAIPWSFADPKSAKVKPTRVRLVNG